MSLRTNDNRFLRFFSEHWIVLCGGMAMSKGERVCVAESSVGVLTTGGSANTAVVSLPHNPAAVRAKNRAWSVFRWLFRKW
jgi:hypothetical protein